MAVAKAEATEIFTPLSSPEIDPDGISYLICRQPDFQKLCQNLIKQIRDSGEDYGWIVYIKRGGQYPAMEIADALGLSETTFSVVATHYDEAGNRLPEVKVHKYLTYGEIARIKSTGEKGLLIDEVNDTTETIGVFINLFKINSLPKSKVAVLHQKTEKMAFPARFVACELEIDPRTGQHPWVIYFWEIGPESDYEFFRGKINAWMEEHHKTFDDCFEIFKQIGFTNEELDAARNQIR